MASVSKPFVATALAQLAWLGEVDLEGRLRDYLPYFKFGDERAYDVTLELLLCHNAGMPDVSDYGWDRPEYDDEALERYVRGLADTKLLKAPVSGARYSNMAFEILGDVISKVSGQSFEDYVRDEILMPAGMEHSTFLRAENR